MNQKNDWKKPVLIYIMGFLLLLFLGSHYVIHEFGHLFDREKAIPKLTELQEEVTRLSNQYKEIVFVEVEELDLASNIRHVKFHASKDPEVNKMYTDGIDKAITDRMPVFINDDLYDTRMVKIINHEYTCMSILESLQFKLVPQLKDHVDMVCTMSIPVSHGKLKGLLTVFIRGPTTDIVEDQIELSVKNIAERIYDMM